MGREKRANEESVSKEGGEKAMILSIERNLRVKFRRTRASNIWEGIGCKQTRIFRARKKSGGKVGEKSTWTT